ncbi:hypothetical protein D3C78_1450300 [compost metagenome]
MYDSSGKIYRVNMQINAPFYESKAAGTAWNTVIDLNSGVYTALGMAPGEGQLVIDNPPESTWSSSTLSRRVINK